MLAMLVGAGLEERGHGVKHTNFRSVCYVLAEAVSSLDDKTLSPLHVSGHLNASESAPMRALGADAGCTLAVGLEVTSKS